MVNFMKRIFISVLLVGSLMASTVVIYDPQSSPITNRVVNVIRSADTLQFQGRTNALINPVLPVTGTLNDWKVTDTLTIVELTTADRTVITNAILASVAANKAAQERTSKTNALAAVDSFEMEGRILRAIAEITMDELNILRAQVALARTNTLAFQSATNRSAVVLNPRTLIQLQNAISNKLQAQSDTAP